MSTQESAPIVTTSNESTCLGCQSWNFEHEDREVAGGAWGKCQCSRSALFGDSTPAASTCAYLN